MVYSERQRVVIIIATGRNSFIVRPRPLRASISPGGMSRPLGETHPMGDGRTDGREKKTVVVRAILPVLRHPSVRGTIEFSEISQTVGTAVKSFNAPQTVHYTPIAVLCGSRRNSSFSDFVRRGNAYDYDTAALPAVRLTDGLLCTSIFPEIL